MRRIYITLLVAWGTSSAAGCVNEYLHGEVVQASSSSGAPMSGDTTGGPEGESSSSGAQSGSGGAEGPTSTGGAPPGSSSSTSSSTSSSSNGEGEGGEGEGGDGDPTGGGDGQTTATSGDPGPLELCEGPCESNAACGTEADRCVDLTESVTVCLRACGRACPDGYTCMNRTDVEGGSSDQCVPDGNMCP